jgi:CO dehydrogenase maturation factor
MGQVVGVSVMSESHLGGKRLIAVCGKGGTGKTALTALMTRVLLDREGTGKLLLIDADPAMGLPSTVGIKVKRTMGQVREEIIKTARGTDKEKKAQLSNMLDYMVLEAIIETDRFSLLAMGRTETLGCFCPVNNLLRDAIESLSTNFDVIIIDGEAGVEQINRQVMRRVGTLIIVSDATSRGVQTAALIKEMVQQERVIQCENVGLVFNRVSGNEELLRQAAHKIGVKVFGFVPHDENIAYHDLLGKPVFELNAASPALVAVRNIVINHVLN